MTDPVMRAVAYLSRVVEPPCLQLAALVARVGPVEAADRVKRRALDDHLMRLTEARHGIDCAAEDLAVLERLGGRLVTSADDEWPLLAFTGFAGVDTKQRPQGYPPLALWLIAPARLDDEHQALLSRYVAAFEQYDYSLASCVAMIMGAVQLVVVAARN